MVNDQRDEASPDYIEPGDAYIKELKWGKDLTNSDDPKRDACSQSNESCRNSFIEVSELKHDVKCNIDLPRVETKYTKWKKGEQFVNCYQSLHWGRSTNLQGPEDAAHIGKVQLKRHSYQSLH